MTSSRLALAPHLDGLRLLPRQTGKALTCWPLAGLPAGGLRSQSPTTLAAALEDGFVGASSEGPNTRLSNRGADPVLVLAGESLPGARRNWCANASAWLSSGVALEIEGGRQLPLSGPAAQLAASFAPVRDQVGVVVAIGDGVAGVALLALPALLPRVLPTLLAPFAIDAVEYQNGRNEDLGAAAVFDAPEDLLRALRAASIGPPLREGLHSIEAPSLQGHALFDLEGALVHLSAFAIPA